MSAVLLCLATILFSLIPDTRTFYFNNTFYSFFAFCYFLLWCKYKNMNCVYNNLQIIIYINKYIYIHTECTILLASW